MTLEIKKSSCRSSIVWSNRDGALNDFHLDYCTKPTLPMLQAITNTSSKTMWQRSDTQLLLGVRCRLAGTWGVTSVHVSTMGNQVARPCSHKNGRCLQWSLWKMSSKIALLLNCPTTVQPGWPVWRSHFRAQSRSSCYFSVSTRSEAIEPYEFGWGSSPGSKEPLHCERLESASTALSCVWPRDLVRPLVA